MQRSDLKSGKDSLTLGIDQLYAMKKLLILLFGFMPALLLAQPQQLSLQNFSTGFSDPVDLCHAGDERIFVVEKRGIINILDQTGNRNPTPFMDIDARVNSGASERGLLGLAFHPNYNQNGYFFVNYTNSSGATVISRFSVTSNSDVADPNSEEILLTITQPFSNHNGGCIKFGPDGYLYIGMGDGGSAGDPGNRSQNGTNLLGKMLRIDVDGGLPYTIPASNPYVGNANVSDEIWAIGMRNPWRFSFDKVKGDIWIGDVGQNVWEEIDFWPANDLDSPKNFGWRCYEGNAAYNTSGCQAQNTYDPPVFEFNHSQNNCSVTGGFVYRGARYQSMWGSYFFTDYCGGYIWSLRDDGMGGWTSSQTNALSSFNLVGFGEDVYGELYVIGTSTGIIYKLEDTTCTPMAFIPGGNSVTVCQPGGNLQAFGGPNLSFQWLQNGSPINGATMATYTPTVADNYSVIVSNGSCSDTSNVVSVTFANAPTVSLSLPMNQYCDIDLPVSAMLSPAGGTLSGPGVAGNFFDPAAAGAGIHTLTYFYTDQQSGCVGQDTFTVDVFMCTAIEDQPIRNFTIVPNPNKGQFKLNFNLNAATTCTLLIQDIHGKVIYRDQLDMNAQMQRLPIDLSGITDGLYFIHLEADNQRLVKKLILQQ